MTGLFASLMAIPFAASAQAQERFGNDGIEFDAPTIVEFEFAGSNGVYQSVFGVVNLGTGERTPLLREQQSGFTQGGGTVANSMAEFEFEANTPYAFYLESSFNGQPAGLVFSTNSRNPNNAQLAVFEGGLSGLNGGGTLIQWDDTGSLLVPPSQQDRDFNDFLVQAGGYIACPYSQAAQSESSVTVSIGESAEQHLALACTTE